MKRDFKTIGKELLELWGRLGLNQRVSVAITTLAVLGGLLLLGVVSSRTRYSPLYTNLSEEDLARTVQALDAAGTKYEFTPGGRGVLVPANTVHQTRMNLALQDISPGRQTSWEVFDKQGLGLSNFHQRTNYKRALQGELAQTISQLKGVANANVQIVVPENRLLIGERTKPTASVFLKIHGRNQIAADSVKAIQYLVSSAVEGLQPNDVAVVDNLGNYLSRNERPNSMAGLTSNQLGVRRELESYFAEKAQGMLEEVLGRGQAVVRVSADINWESTSKTEVKFDPEGQVARIETLTDENTVSTTSEASGGVPGMTSNVTFTNNVANGSGNTNSVRKKITNNEYALSQTTHNVMQSPGGIKRISAAIFVAPRYNGTGTDRQAVPRSPEEIQKLKDLVQSALGIQNNDPLRKDEITLEEVEFNQEQVIQWRQEMDRQEHREFWTGLVRQILYPVGAILVLYVFWRSFRKTQSTEFPIGVPVGEFAEGAGVEGNGAGTGKSGEKGGDRSGAEELDEEFVSVDLLNRLIREHPDNMSQAVRSWLTRGDSESM